MKIDTEHNLGDVVWGVARYYSNRLKPCESCVGKGGANILHTKVFVKCQDCDGNGEVESRVVEFSPTRQKIHSIDIHHDLYGNSRTTFGFMCHTTHVSFQAVTTSKDHAILLAQKLAERESGGIALDRSVWKEEKY